MVRVADADEIRAVLMECRRELDGGRVDNVHQSDDQSLVLTLYARDRGKRFLFLCARKNLMRFHLLVERPAALSRPPVFCEVVRKSLKGRFLWGVRPPTRGLGLELRFVRSAESESERGAVDLALWLDGPRRGISLLSVGRDGRDVVASIGGGLAVGATVDALGPDAWQHEADAASEPAASAGGTLRAPVSVRLAERYRDLSDTVLLDERQRELLRAVRREVKRRDKTLLRVGEDLEKAKRGEGERIRGELLQAALGQVRRGMPSIEVVNYFDPKMATMRLELDPALAPQENLKRYFKRYQKAKRALPYVEARLSRLTTELEALREVLIEAETARELAVLAQLEEKARPLLKGRRQKTGVGTKRPHGEPPEPLGPRRFLSSDGYELLVGRNARGNDQLSTRLARGNDLFLHVAGRPGAHVIIRTRPGKSVPQPTLLDGAQLALYYALPEKLRRVGGAEARGEVDYTPAKYVQKPKGTRAGLVYLSKHKTLHVQLDSEAMGRLMRSTEHEA